MPKEHLRRTSQNRSNVGEGCNVGGPEATADLCLPIWPLQTFDGK